MKLADLTPKPRHDKIMLAVNGILRQIDAPIGTSELVKRVTAFLSAEEGTSYVAKELQKAVGSGHPLRKPTGEVFKKYGREMPRYEWLPSYKGGTPQPEPEPLPVKPLTEPEYRAYRQREIEADRPDPGPWPDDEWTVHPAPPEEGDPPTFLEED